MRRLLVLFFGLALQAGASFACDKWEYAKFKDATKKELVEEYCYSKAIAEIEGKRKDNARQYYGSSSTEYDNRAADQISCLRQVDEASSMLMKKYKANPPACPKKKGDA